MVFVFFSLPENVENLIALLERALKWGEYKFDAKSWMF